jgi:hypothetical protein
MISALMTLPQQAVELPPPSVLALRTNLTGRRIANLLAPFGKLTFGVIIASPTTTSQVRNQGTLGAQQQNLTLQPLTAVVPTSAQDSIEKFGEALTDALELANTMVADEEGDPVDDQTWIYAIQSLAPLVMSLKLPPPLILPLQNGGIGAEWHTFGINIELRFRKPYDIYAVLEDAQGAFPTYHGRDPDLVHARSALRELGTRSVG